MFVSVGLAALALACGFTKGRASVTVGNEDHRLSADKVALARDGEIYAPENKDGGFRFSPRMRHAGYYSLTVGPDRTEIFLSPGDRLLVRSGFRASSPASPFSGPGSLLSDYIFEDEAFFESITAGADFDVIYALPPLEFSARIDSLYRPRTERLEAFVRSRRVRQARFVATERKRIFYASAAQKNLYYRDHKFLTGEVPVLDAAFDVYLRQADLNDRSSLHLDAYKDFLYSYFERMGLRQHDLARELGGGAPFTTFSYARAKEDLRDSRVKDYVLSRIADVHLNETPVDELGTLVDDLIRECRDETYLAPIRRYYARLSKLKRGLAAPDFSFPDATGRVVSLSDFRGNLVYLDVWNSTCSPCFKEFPLFERLRAKYRGRKIVFLGVSLDSDKALWKRAMKAKGAAGVQLFGNGWDSRFVQDYLVYTNPRFILIDEDGDFISAKAPRPSENVEELIERSIK